MPIFIYTCDNGCIKKTMKQDGYLCEHGLPMKRGVPDMTTTAMEVVDNGLMMRKIETYVGVSEMVSERSASDPRLTRDIPDGQA